MTYENIFLYHFCGGKWLNSKFLNPAHSNRNCYSFLFKKSRFMCQLFLLAGLFPKSDLGIYFQTTFVVENFAL